jgi:hypothetical protein
VVSKQQGLFHLQFKETPSQGLSEEGLERAQAFERKEGVGKRLASLEGQLEDAIEKASRPLENEVLVEDSTLTKVLTPKESKGHLNAVGSSMFILKGVPERDKQRSM